MSLELYGDEKNSNYMLEIDILRNSSPKILGVLRGAFLEFGCPKRHPDALLAKTMLGRMPGHLTGKCFLVLLYLILAAGWPAHKSEKVLVKTAVSFFGDMINFLEMERKP